MRFSSLSSKRKPINIAILGFGTVGSGVYNMLIENASSITNKAGTTFVVKKVVVKDPRKKRNAPAELFTTDPWEVVNDPNIQVIIELIGGTDPAAKIVEAALKSGKSVVTANKELIAKHGSRLVTLARKKQLDLHYEAAVGAGIPIIQPLKHQLAGNDVLKMIGILNGTTNYILTQMQEHDAEFEEALATAQELGYAETDPTNDIEAFDAAYKIAVLASIAYGKQVPSEKVYRQGISQVKKTDIQIAKSLGYRIKLVAAAQPMPDGRILARTHPALLPISHPLANINDVNNGLCLQTDFAGDLLLSGRGAGANPTASAIIGDLIDVARNILVQGPASAIPYSGHQKMAKIEQLQCPFYCRLTAQDQKGGLAKIAYQFGRNGVSLRNLNLSSNPNQSANITLITNSTTLPKIQRTTQQLIDSGHVLACEALIMVEE